MQTTKATHTHYSFELGLGYLTCSSEMADYIGMESCVDLKPDDQDDMMTAGKDERAVVDCSQRCGGKRDRRLEMRREKKEYPPPIPLQAWGMRRYYTSDGRLIIKEERANHEYFRAHRSDGRLTLQLVPIHDQYDDDVLTHPLEEDEEEEEVTNDVDGDDNNSNNDDDDNNNNDDDGHDEIDGGDDICGGTKTEEIHQEDDGKVAWYKYDNVRMSPCMYGLPVPAIRPVHI